MNCQNFEEQANLYLDGLLNEGDAQQLKAHMEECPACRELFRRLESAQRAVASLEELPLPEGFEEELHRRLEGEKKMKRPWYQRTGAWIGGIAAALVILVIGTSALGKSGQAKMTRDGMAETTSAAMAAEGYGGDKNSFAVDEEAWLTEEGYEPIPEATWASEGIEKNGGRSAASDGNVSAYTEKLVYTADVSLRSYDFDADFAALRSQVEALGGFVENSGVSGMPFTAEGGRGRNGNLCLRVPQEKYAELLQWVQSVGEVTGSYENVTNITQEYTQTEIRLNTLKGQIARLQELIAQAENLEDMITLESKLGDVTAELEWMQSQMDSMNYRVSYSTITVSVQEVATAGNTPTPTGRSFGRRILDAMANGWVRFTANLEDTVLDLFAVLPTLLLWVVVIVLVVLLVRRIIRRRKK